MKKFRKLFSAAALFTALAVFLSGSALAVSGEAFVATDALNMREGASLDYNVIDAAPRGAHVTVNFDAGQSKTKGRSPRMVQTARICPLLFLSRKFWQKAEVEPVSVKPSWTAWRILRDQAEKAA